MRVLNGDSDWVHNWFSPITNFRFVVYTVSESSVTSHQSGQPAKANLSRQGSIVQAPPIPGQPNKVPLDDSEDTMKNLRKTFAGIFGEM